MLQLSQSLRCSGSMLGRCMHALGSYGAQNDQKSQPSGTPTVAPCPQQQIGLGLFGPFRKTAPGAGASLKLPASPFRTFASSAAAPSLVEPAATKQVARLVLDNVKMRFIKEELEQEAVRHFFITFDRFAEIARSSGAAHTKEEVDELVAALHKSAFILRLADTIYLRPAEVAELVLLALPSDGNEFKQKLKEIEAELVVLEAQHSNIQQSASRTPQVMLWGGFFLLLSQFAGFFYLTFYELSWDVMEPVRFRVGTRLFLLVAGGVGGRAREDARRERSAALCWIESITGVGYKAPGRS